MVVDARDRGGGAHGVTLAANLLLAAGKLGVGWFAGSQALIADGWHSLSDVAMNGLAWTGYRLSKTPPDEDHHYGHGNWEAIAGLVVGLIIIAAGVAVVASVFVGEDTSLKGVGRGWLALGVAIVAAAVKLQLALYTRRVGTELNSPSLLAVSRDNLSDAMTGLLVPVAIGASLLGISWAEPLVAVLLGFVIGWMGIQSAKEALDILTDRVSDPGLRGRLAETAGAVEGVRGVQSVRVHPLGSHFRVDMEISVVGGITVAEGHRIAHAVEQAVVESHPHVEAVHVHVNPAEELS